MKDLFDEFGKIIFAKSHVHDPDVIKFYDAIFDTDHDDTISALRRYLGANNELARSIFRKRPDRIQFFAAYPKYIRNLWYKYLFKGRAVNDTAIYCALLRNNLIPPGQLDEAHATILKRGVTPPTDSSCDQLLKDTGFYRVLYTLAFEEKEIASFNFDNENAELIVYYLQSSEIDETIARALSSTFSSQYHPYELKAVLNKFFREHETKRQEYRDIMKTHNISLPTKLNLDADEQTPDDLTW
jgi:hypothetical protein